MITGLVEIKRLGEKRREENKRFRGWLKSHNFVERRFKAIAQEIEESIDCTKCANCCRVATTQISERDAERLARFLGMRPHEFLEQYTDESPEEGRILKRTADGCVFLKDNLVYGFMISSPTGRDPDALRCRGPFQAAREIAR